VARIDLTSAQARELAAVLLAGADQIDQWVASFRDGGQP
jgi:hypothetical protein